jgi:hypothetical protein
MSLYTNYITRRKYTKIIPTKTCQNPKRISWGLNNRQRVGENKNVYKKGSQWSNRKKEKEIWKKEKFKNLERGEMSLQTNEEITKDTCKTLVKKTLKRTK